MKILHILNVKNTAGNGVAEAVKQYVKYESRYADVSLWYIDGQLTIPGIKTYTNDCKTISAIIDDDKPDLIIFNEVYKKEYLKAYKECLHSGIPYIVIPHGSLTKEAQKKKRTKKKLANILFFANFLKNASAVQFLNKYEKNMSIKPKANIIIHGNGVDKVVPNHNKKRNNKIVYIGRYSIFHKGIDLLLDAICQIHDFLKANHIQVEFYGRDSINTAQEIINLIETKKLDDIVSVNGPIYGKTKERILEDADYFVLTSRFEGEPMSVIEALSYGTPCIVTQETSFGELINREHCGIGTVASSTGIAKAIKKTISSADHATMSKQALEVVKKEFLWQKIVKQTMMDYEKIVNKN